jgi:hypothetical protein
MSTLLNFGRDVQGFNAYAPQFPTDIFTATLVGDAHSSVTVPSNHQVWLMYVRMQPGGWCYVSRNDTAAVPASGDFSASTSDLAVGTIEFKRIVYAGDVIDFLTSVSDTDVVVEFFAISYP